MQRSGALSELTSPNGNFPRVGAKRLLSLNGAIMNPAAGNRVFSGSCCSVRHWLCGARRSTHNFGGGNSSICGLLVSFLLVGVARRTSIILPWTWDSWRAARALSQDSIESRVTKPNPLDPRSFVTISTLNTRPYLKTYTLEHNYFLLTHGKNIAAKSCSRKENGMLLTYILKTKEIQVIEAFWLVTCYR